MPNDDFSIKTGIEVDDAGLEKLKSFSESLTNIAESLDRIGSSKFNTGLTSGLKNAKSEAAKVKKEFDGIVNTLNNNNKKNTGNGASLGVEQATKTAFNAINPEIYSRINESLNNAALAAEKIKNALGGNVQSGILTQINDMLAKKDELQNLVSILQSNQKALNNAAKATGAKNKNAVPYDTYMQNYKQWQSDAIKSIKNEYSGSDIVGAKISQTSSGLVKLSASIRTADGEWQKYNATVSETGSLMTPSIQNMTNAAASSAEKAFQDIKSGLIAPDQILNFDEMEKYSEKVTEIFNSVYGSTEKYKASVDAVGKVSISKVFPNGQEINTLTAQYNDVKSLIENYESCAGDMMKMKQIIEGTFASASYTNANGQTKSSSTPSTTSSTPKYTTNKNYVDSYKFLSNIEAEYQLLNTFKTDNERLIALQVERQGILDRMNTMSPQNNVEANAKTNYESMVQTISGNISKYSSQIQQAFSDISGIESTKTNIESVSSAFASGRENVLKWASALSTGKMSVSDFDKNVAELKTSLNSIYKVIQPGSDKQTGIAELKSMFTDLSNNAKNIDFGPIVTKINSAGQEVVKMTASFNDSTGSVQKLTGQVNLATGEVQKLGDSTQNIKSGFSKFFDGWKGKVQQLATFVTSFYALRQAWNVLKEGISIITEFDTALAEMRKVSTESVTSLKNFQKESFDLANSVGSTALQIQNSTADFMRVGESFEEAKTSAKNANKLLTVSEFENIDDATSALISMKAAYTDLSEDQIIDKLNAVGDNYAISTDQVATGLQKAGSTLSLLGNNIDEAAALITAGKLYCLRNIEIYF